MSVGAVTTSMAGTCDAISLPLPVILLLAGFIFVIIILSFFLVHYRRRLNSTREALARYICIYLSLKDFVPSEKFPIVNRMKDPVTPEEFIQIINRMLKRMMLLPLFILPLLPVSAQGSMGEAASADSLYEFRFSPKNDRFFGAFKENEAQLKALSELVDCHRPAIEAGTMPVTETNSDNGGTSLPEKTETAETAVATATDATAVPVSCSGGIPKLTLRTNLLRWATLTPDLGLEWRISHNVGILVNGTWTSWNWDNKNRRYALWKISPEVRYYIGKEKRGYLGAMYHIGEFNYKLGDTGKQGDYQGGGITGGWQLPLNRALSLDFHAALGYTYADYDKYNVMDGVRVRQGSDSKNYWGINQLGITLVWKFLK